MGSKSKVRYSKYGDDWKFDAPTKWESELRSRERREKERQDRLRAEAEYLAKQLNEEILRLIRNRELTPTAKFMARIKDQTFKQRVIEAVCLSKV